MLDSRFENVANRISFDAVDIDVTGHRLRVDNVEVPLERKAFVVLVLLASNPGRVFTRDEILDAVWGHTHVTPGVLNRIVTLLRQALGESAESQRYLHTVHGVGYRFDRKVQPAASEEANTQDHDGTKPPEPALQAGPEPRAKRAIAARHMLWAALAVGALGMLGWLGMRTGLLSGDAAPPTLLVMPLKPIGSEEAAHVIADGLGEELICGLAKIDGLRVIAHRSALAAATEAIAPTQMAQTLGATHSLEGNLQQSGQELRVRLHMVDLKDGSTVWIKEFDREASQVLDLQRAIASEVAGSLALKMGLAAKLEVESGDAEFLRRYMAARMLLEDPGQNAEESLGMAEAELRALLQERPDDARAHAGLAIALVVSSRYRPQRAAELGQEALQHAIIARQLDPAQAESFAVEASVACGQKDWERCLSLSAKAYEISPSNQHVAMAYIVNLAGLGFLERAEAIARETSKRDPLNQRVNLMLGRILDARGQHVGARTQLLKAGSVANEAVWFNAVWRGDAQGALQVGASGIGKKEQPVEAGSTPPSDFLVVSQALIDPGSWTTAKEQLERIERSHGQWSATRIVTPDAAEQAAGVIGELLDARARGSFSLGLMLWAKPLSWLRRDPAFQALLQDDGILAYWKATQLPTQCRLQDKLAICD